ncbi:MAG TPA: hypothetical protein VIK74_10390, partial [Parasegetibacter sp.]
MKRRVNILSFFPIVFLIISTISGCGKKHVDQRVTLWRLDKNPYGTWVAYNNLSQIFPEATIQTNTQSPNPFKLYEAVEESFSSSGGSSGTVTIIITPQLRPDVHEWVALFNKVRRGEHVFISALDIDRTVIDSLSLVTSAMSPELFLLIDSLEVSVFEPEFGEEYVFSYPGRNGERWIESLDSNYTNILGKNDYGMANYVRWNFESGGSLSLHLVPMAFTNYFLLHKNNLRYYDMVLSHLPKRTRLVVWDDYFRNHTRGAVKDFSRLQVILSHQSLRWAFFVVLLIFALLYLFESKRRQALIPVISRHRNTSLDFVRTVGALYFQKKDNKNLAQKIIAHFLERVRTKYNISTTTLDEE